MTDIAMPIESKPNGNGSYGEDQALRVATMQTTDGYVLKCCAKQCISANGACRIV